LTDILFVLSKLLWLALRPGTFALLVAFAGLVAVWRGRRWGRWPILAGLGFYFALLLLPLHIWVQMPLEDRFPRPAEAPARVDGIVVLGGAVEQDLTEARGIPTVEEQQPLYEDINEQVMEFLPGVPIASPVPTLAFSPDVEGFVPSPVQDEPWNNVVVAE